ncbi:hypothetical protein GCM10008922_01180 [Faecalicatena contorta]|nr:hypothetical protein CE91St64_02850 [Faecalicatena contorta]
MLHEVVGVDVEHVNGSKRIQEEIEECGGCAASQVEQGAVSEMTEAQVLGGRAFHV